ncbi:MAG: toll/interleukin-1 receptor domain-containing protein [Gemmatimonadota bacterium]|nr:toll/interleukin-1 receptor domain-containing protein [Gemmatimonadota bacterium]
MKVFISYSHRDDEALNRLHTHLAPLRSEGLIDAWFDREILAGENIDAEITKELESCDLFLMLVSPDFLASDYCVNREMKRALERHRDGAVHVVAIIIEPCDWFSLPIHELKVLPRDGKAISEWMNQNSAYLDVVQELRRIIETRKDTVPGTERTSFSGGTMDTSPMAPSYRIKKDFDEIHRSEFRETAFATIRDYFQQQIDLINTIDDLRGRFVSYGPSSFGCTIVNRARLRNQSTAHITVHYRNGRMGLGDISYSFSENSAPNMANGIFYIESDGYEQYLVNTIGFRDDQGQLTPKNAAERLWTEFIQQIGVSLG